MTQYSHPHSKPLEIGVYLKRVQRNFNKKHYKYRVNRALLPAPASYYNAQFPTMKIRSEWVKVCCCFHEDKTPSLSLNMAQGHFKCHACGAKGGDIIAFHMQRYKLGFVETTHALGALEVENDYCR